MLWVWEGELGSRGHLTAFHSARARLYASLHKMLNGLLSEVEVAEARPPLGAVGTLGGGFAQTLTGLHTPWLRQVGQALRWLINHDRESLDAAVGAPRVSA